MRGNFPLCNLHMRVTVIKPAKGAEKTVSQALKDFPHLLRETSIDSIYSTMNQIFFLFLLLALAYNQLLSN